jgi:hypothetical protein
MLEPDAKIAQPALDVTKRADPRPTFYFRETGRTLRARIWLLSSDGNEACAESEQRKVMRLTKS